MTDKQNPSFTRYYGLPNGAAKAYFVCQKYLNNGQNALFVSSSDTDDFDDAAHEFAPRGAQVFHLPETDTGRLNALYALLAPASGPRLVSTSYEMLSTPLPDPEEFKKSLFIVHRGDTMRRQELLDRLEQADGRKPILYTTRAAYRLYLQDRLPEYQVWIRDILKKPRLEDGRNWLFWQYTGRGRLEGYAGEEKFIDLNVFGGSEDEWQSYLESCRAAG